MCRHVRRRREANVALSSSSGPAGNSGAGVLLITTNYSGNTVRIMAPDVERSVNKALVRTYQQLPRTGRGDGIEAASAETYQPLSHPDRSMRENLLRKLV